MGLKKRTKISAPKRRALTLDKALETLRRIEIRCLSRIEEHRISSKSLEEYYKTVPYMGAVYSVLGDCREFLSLVEGGSHE